MNLLLQGLLEALTAAGGTIMKFFMGDFWAKLAIPTITNGTVEGPFDQILPGVQTFRTMFITIAVTLALLLFIVSIFRSFFPDTNSSKAPDPLITSGRFLIAMLLIFGAYSIIAAFQQPMAMLCDDLATMTGANISNTFTAGNTTEISRSSTDVLTHIMNWYAGKGVVDTLGGAIIAFVMTMVLIWSFIKLVLEIIERYVLLCFMFYISPLPAAAFVSEDTANITKNFIRMIFSQYILIMLNFCFLYVFCYAYSHQENFLTGTSTEVTPTQLILLYGVLLAWLRLGQRMDEHLSSLGLSVAQTGAGLGQEIIGGFSVTMGTAFGLAKATKGIASAGKKGYDAVTKSSTYSASKNTPAGVQSTLSGRKMQQDTANNHAASAAMAGHFPNVSQQHMNGISAGNGKFQFDTNNGSAIMQQQQFSNASGDSVQIPLSSAYDANDKWVATLSSPDMLHDPAVKDMAGHAQMAQTLMDHNSGNTMIESDTGFFRVNGESQKDSYWAVHKGIYSHSTLEGLDAQQKAMLTKAYDNPHNSDYINIPYAPCLEKVIKPSNMVKNFGHAPSNGISHIKSLKKN